MTDVKAVSRGIKADVESRTFFRQIVTHLILMGDLSDISALDQRVKYVFLHLVQPPS